MHSRTVKAISGFLLGLALLAGIAQSDVTSGIARGSSTPSTCTVGDLFFKTSATIGLLQCKTANTFTTVGGTSTVPSMQYGSITLSNVQTSNTATISAITVANSAVKILGIGNSGSSVIAFDDEGATVVITNTTTITATRVTAASTLTINFEVDSYPAGALKSNQDFSISQTGTSNTATLTAVVVAKTMIYDRGQTDTAAGDTNPGRFMTTFTLTNTTTVTSTRGDSTTGTPVRAGTAVEFN